MKKKVLIILLLILTLSGITALTEFLFYKQDEKVWVEHIEYRLHQQEELADKILQSFRDSVDLDQQKWEEDMIFVGFRQAKIFFWTNELNIEGDLYSQLATKGNFIKIGNTYYEIRRKTHKDIEFFALLKILDVYPYSTEYLKNKFSDFLKISENNLDQLHIFTTAENDTHIAKDKDGNLLFYLSFGDNYQENKGNYILASLYLIFFLGLFSVYNLALKHTSSWKKQLGLFSGFLIFLCGLRLLTLTCHFPSTLYRLPIFEHTFSSDLFISSIGDLILTAFCVFQLVYITLSNIRINYENKTLQRYRYFVACILISFVFLYVDLFNLAIDLIVENIDVHLNIAQLINIGWASILSFIAISLGGLMILILIFSIVSVFEHILSFVQVVITVSSICVLLWITRDIFYLNINYWDCLFIWTISLLIASNKYLLKRDIQRSLYIIVIFFLSVYVVMETKKYERYKEQRLRMEYATELIEERDYKFEEQLTQIQREIDSSSELEKLIKQKQHEKAEVIIHEQLLDISGSNYKLNIALCSERDQSSDTAKQNPEKCYKYFEQLIQHNGKQIGSTNFYAIDIFDGFTTYIGRIPYENTSIYLHFSTKREEDRLGYTQTLSRSGNKNNSYYVYSYAKFSQGELVASSGSFVYHKKLTPLGGTRKNGIFFFNNERYSHMLLPVDKENTLVVSLPENTFNLYYMNVFYAFFIYIIISSYGLFFHVNRSISFHKGTLKSQIKNNVISLIFVLLVLLTTLSIYMNTTGFKNLHNAKMVDLLRTVNQELEDLDSMDAEKYPAILQTLSTLSELLLIDINIYSDNGKLVSSSRPEIFTQGLDGTLINPQALKKIIKEGKTSYIEGEDIGELSYISAYMPLFLDNGQMYILNVPYFAQYDELNLNISIIIVVTVNIAIIMMVLAFVLSGMMAERVTKPLQLVNNKLREMHIGGKNEKITYNNKDEIGVLVSEYNNMVNKLDESIEQIARSERENAWQEMARQIAHEIKNPLTPMKLNIQFMLRSLQMEDQQKFKQRFRDISEILIEQIDNMAATASTFSDFAKISVANNESFSIDELVRSCTMLFKNNIEHLICEANSNVNIFSDKEQMRRVLINLLKNAEQSIPENSSKEIKVSVQKIGDKVVIRIRDNGCGIPPEIRQKIFEPNFTTKSGGTGLGLAICHRIIESFGGEIRFTSELEKGSEFFITLNCYQHK